MRNRPLIALILLVVVIASAVALLSLLTGPSDRNQVDIGLLMEDIRHGKVASLSWEGTLVTGTYVNGQAFETRYVEPRDAAGAVLVNLIEQTNESSRGAPIKLQILDRPATGIALSVLSVIAFPLMLIALIYFLVLRPAQKRIIRRPPDDR